MNGMDADAGADVTTRVCRYLFGNKLSGSLPASWSAMKSLTKL